MALSHVPNPVKEGEPNVVLVKGGPPTVGQPRLVNVMLLVVTASVVV
jgi:hypothetical protein